MRSTWCLTRPKPADESVNAGQKIGAPSSNAIWIRLPAFLAFPEASQRRAHRAGGILDGHREDIGGPRGVAAGEAHLAHGVDHRPRVVGGDVDVLDQLGQQLGFGVRGGCVHELEPRSLPLKGRAYLRLRLLPRARDSLTTSAVSGLGVGTVRGARPNSDSIGGSATSAMSTSPKPLKRLAMATPYAPLMPIST